MGTVNSETIVKMLPSIKWEKCGDAEFYCSIPGFSCHLSDDKNGVATVYTRFEMDDGFVSGIRYLMMAKTIRDKVLGAYFSNEYISFGSGYPTREEMIRAVLAAADHKDTHALIYGVKTIKEYCIEVESSLNFTLYKQY